MRWAIRGDARARGRASSRQQSRGLERLTGNRMPDLRLSGQGLRAVGFDLGQVYEVDVWAGRLVVLAV